jgi:hypothetical protein
MAILAVLMLLAGIAGFIYDNVEVLEDDSIALFGVQIACPSDGLCNRENLPATTSESSETGQ